VKHWQGFGSRIELSKISCEDVPENQASLGNTAHGPRVCISPDYIQLRLEDKHYNEGRQSTLARLYASEKNVCIAT